jgi:hypothetical protein
MSVDCDFFVEVTATFRLLYVFVVIEHGSIFARSLDDSIRNLGLAVLKSPPHSPKANAICERVIGTIRRECLDWLIQLSESHLRSILGGMGRSLQRWTSALGARIGVIE